MNTPPMTSLQRAMTTLGYQEPDRVPLFLNLTMHGGKELGLSIREYNSRPDYVVEGQLRLHKKFGHDCVLGFLYGAQEIEAFGGETIFIEDGPPNAGAPILRSAADIFRLEPPRIQDSLRLQQVLEIIRQLKGHLGESVPIVASVISPFSLPVMQMGFEPYLNLIFEQPEAFWRLMQVNQVFCIEWANAQLAAGATAIGYADPVSSTTIIPRQDYLRTGYLVAQRTIPHITGGVATSFASGRCMPILDDVAQTGTVGVGVSFEEDLATLKKAAAKRFAIMGNLNGVEMRRWSPAQAEAAVKNAIAAAGRGGGFVLTDSHGEIPYQVTDETLFAIVEAVRKYGRYPLTWIDEQT